MSVPSLAAWGIQRPEDVVSLAAGAGLELAAACALLEQESSGGHNVFGRDNVPTGGAYVKGAPVDEASYRAYAAWRDQVPDGRGRCQGVGPCQLTSREYQVRADALGGCWRPIPNMRVGFALFATYARQWGLADAARAYNGGAGNRRAGSNANADRYSREFGDKYGRWLDRLGATTTQEEDMPLTDQDVARIADAVTDRILTRPLRDLYSTDPNAPAKFMDVATTLQWAAANAGRAIDAARAAAAVKASTPVGDVNAAIRAALDALGPLELVPTRELEHGQ